MSVKKIVQYPHNKLKERSIEVKELDDIKPLIADLKDTLENSKVAGVGLAAVQIGVLKRIFVARKYFTNSSGEEEYQEKVFINPVILKSSKKTQKSLEGCLSIKDTYGFVNRNKQVKVRYTDEFGQVQIIGASGFFAFVLQHEIDHLDGKLFIDKLIDNKSYTEKEIDRYLSKYS